jgi:hypothetical protein
MFDENVEIRGLEKEYGRKEGIRQGYERDQGN